MKAMVISCLRIWSICSIVDLQVSNIWVKNFPNKEEETSIKRCFRQGSSRPNLRRPSRRTRIKEADCLALKMRWMHILCLKIPQRVVIFHLQKRRYCSVSRSKLKPCKTLTFSFIFKQLYRPAKKMASRSPRILTALSSSPTTRTHRAFKWSLRIAWCKRRWRALIALPNALFKVNARIENLERSSSSFGWVSSRPRTAHKLNPKCRSSMTNSLTQRCWHCPNLALLFNLLKLSQKYVVLHLLHTIIQPRVWNHFQNPAKVPFSSAARTSISIL